MMINDRNADLIGKTLTIDGIPFTVRHSWDYVGNYVLMQGPLHTIIRPASVIRRSLELTP